MVCVDASGKALVIMQQSDDTVPKKGIGSRAHGIS